jgi:hypothetical protein
LTPLAPLCVGRGWKTASPARVKAVQDYPTEWLIEARERRRKKRDLQRRQEQIEREATGQLRCELAGTLVTSFHEAWFQELKIDREQDAAREAGRYRASRLARRAFGGDGG